MTTQNPSYRELYNQELLGTNEIFQSVNVLQAWQLSVMVPEATWRKEKNDVLSWKLTSDLRMCGSTHMPTKKKKSMFQNKQPT